MDITLNSKVGEVVKMNFKTAPFFLANKIDYCCGGNKTISEAGREAGVDSNLLIAQLEKIAEDVDPDTEYINNLLPDELSEYIVKRHHTYVKKYIPFLQESLEKIGDVHGSNHPELFEIKKLFDDSAGALTMHMQKEEIILFPYIQKMAEAKRTGTADFRSDIGTVSNPIRMMVLEHETEGRRFDEMAELSGDYEIPADACTTYRATINQLKDFENDLHRHIHLENNILFPKAIELEKELLS